MQRKRLAYMSASVIAVLAIFAILSSPLASAATIEAYRVRGMGVAVEEPEGDLHRSKIGFLAQVESRQGDSIHFGVRRGLLVINCMRDPVRYRMVADTWHGIAHSDGKFTAEGKVSDADGNTYNLVLKGDGIRQTSRGKLMMLHAVFSGSGENYDTTHLALLDRVLHDTTEAQLQNSP